MDAMEIAGTLVGLLYLWWEYRASIWLWAASVVMPALSLAVYYRAGLYADFGINVYYLLAGIYGWLVWMGGRRKERGEEMPVVHTPARLVLPLAAVTAVLLVGMAWVLIRYTDSTVPWADSLTTALSVVAMWMLAHKQAEQWLVWLVVDAVSCGLYVYKGLPFYAALYGIYTVIAWFGYRKWIRLIRS